MMINHHGSVVLLKYLYLLNRYTLSRAPLRQSEFLRCNTVVRIEEDEIAILKLYLDPLNPPASFLGPSGKRSCFARNRIRGKHRMRKNSGPLNSAHIPIFRFCDLKEGVKELSVKLPPFILPIQILPMTTI